MKQFRFLALITSASMITACSLIVGSEDTQTRQLYRQTCAGSAHPLLRCDAPVVLTRGITLSFPYVANRGDNFLVSFLNDTNIELHEVSPSGARVSDQPVAASNVSTDYVKFSATGNFWALAWRDPNSEELGCTTSAMAGQSSYFDLTDAGFATGVFKMGIATDGSGNISSVISPTDTEPLLFAGTSSNTCPTFFQPVTVTNGDTFGLTPVVVPGAAADAWPLVASTVGDRSLIELLTTAGGGGFLDTAIATNNTVGQGDLAAVLSSDGQTIVSAFEGDSSTGPQLQLLGIAVDGHVSSSQALVMDENPDYWTLSNCGAGCTATTYVTGTAASNITVGFVADQLSLHPLGPMLFDVACNQTFSTIPGVAGGYAGGRLGVLFTAANEADFYICDVPPF